MKIDFDEREHRYTVDGVEFVSVTQLLRRMGVDSYGGNVDPEIMNRAAELGKATEDACRLHDLGRLDRERTAPVLLAAVNKWDAALDRFRIIPAAHQVKVASKALRVAGTIDALGVEFTDETPVVLDAKHTAATLPEHVLQVALYCEIMREKTGRDHRGYVVNTRTGKVDRVTSIDKNAAIAFAVAYQYKQAKGIA